MEYSSYIDLQKQKTCDPVRRKKWLNEEWSLKLNGFKKIFNNNIDFIGEKCLCIGARTGQEVQALLDIGKHAIGIDLVPQEPLVLEGDLHNLDFKNDSFNFIFSNVLDHSLYPDKFFSEAIRVCKQGGYILLHLVVDDTFPDTDRYGVFEITDIEKDIIPLIKKCQIVKNRHNPRYIGLPEYPEFHCFNVELVIKVNK